MEVWRRIQQLGPGIQAARAKLNTCSELSRTGQGDEARAIAVEVQETILGSLLPDAQKLAAAGEKRGVDAVKELRVLQCAALLAEAFDAQQVLEQPDSVAKAPGETSPVAASSSSSQRSLYIKARELAESSLPPIHPMVALARSLCHECGASASSETASVTLPPLSPKSPGGHKAQRSPANSSPSSPQQRPKMLAALPEAPVEQPVKVAVRAASPAPSQGASSEKAVKLEAEAEGGKEKRSLQPISKQSSAAQSSQNQDSDHDEDYHDDDHVPRVPRNIFAEYIDDYRMSIEMHKPWFQCRQDEMRKHVIEQARTARLENNGKDIYALADTKYSAIGHKIQTRALMKNNKSRSEPSLMQSVKIAGVASPEAFMTSKLRLILDPQAKPMTQPKRKKRFTEE